MKFIPRCPACRSTSSDLLRLHDMLWAVRCGTKNCVRGPILPSEDEARAAWRLLCARASSMPIFEAQELVGDLTKAVRGHHRSAEDRAYAALVARLTGSFAQEESNG